MSEYIIRPPERVDSSLSLWPIIVGEIVRCRDCRWIHMFLDYERTYPEITMYTAYECACLNRRIYDMDMFCAWGVKRKEGGV